MPRAKHTLVSLKTGLGELRAREIVISCEHASNRIPSRYKLLGLPAARLETHIAWDPGAKEMARACARLLGCPCHEGRYSRLLVDLNRSSHHPHLMAKQSAGIGIRGNGAISKHERNERIKRYYIPYREALLSGIRSTFRRQGRCIHFCMQSFTPSVLGAERRADYGILFDPRRPRERALSLLLAGALREQGWLVRFNYPYRGVNDGFTSMARLLFSPRRYLGIEIELNQKYLRDPESIRRMARQFARTLAEVVERAGRRQTLEKSAPQLGVKRREDAGG
jgi:predicted N-formylglutamate amidohydrolase